MKKPTAIVRVCRNVKRGKRFVAYIYRDGARVLIGGNLPGGLTGDPVRDYDSLLIGHHGAGRLLRSVVISLDCPTSPAMVALHSDGLARCAIAFCAKFAPGSPFLFAIHKAGGKFHCHILPQNSCNGEKCLEWGPDVLREMQGFQWSVEFESGRGKGLNEVSGKTSYPGKSTAAAKLAGMEVQELKALIGSGDLAVSRTRKDGSALSLVYEGRKMRVQTVSVLAADFAIRLQAAMTGTGGDYLNEYLQSNRAANQAARDNGKAH